MTLLFLRPCLLPTRTGIAGTFSTNRTEMNLNTTSVVVEKGTIPEALIFVQFPKGKFCKFYKNKPLLQLRLNYLTKPPLTLSAVVPDEAAIKRATPSNVSLGFVLYQNDRFFRSRSYKRQRATIRVLSGTVQGPLVPQHLEMMFRPQVRKMCASNFFFSLFQPPTLNLTLTYIKGLSSCFLCQDLQCSLK